MKTPARQFRLTVELGNDAMRTNRDLMDLLRDLITDLRDNQGHCPQPGEEHSVRDVNGNRVGKWEVS